MRSITLEEMVCSNLGAGFVSDNSELKKLILREFHVKPYSGRPRYQKTLTAINKFYYWLNLKKDMAEFVAKCLECH